VSVEAVDPRRGAVAGAGKGRVEVRLGPALAYEIAGVHGVEVVGGEVGLHRLGTGGEERVTGREARGRVEVAI